MFRFCFLTGNSAIVNLRPYEKLLVYCRFPKIKSLAEQKTKSEQRTACLLNKKLLKICK